MKGISEIGRDCGADRTHPLGAAGISGVHFSVSCVIWRQCRQVDGAPADRAAGEGPKDAPPGRSVGRSVGRGSRITPDRRPTRSEGSCVAARCCPGGDRPSFVWESRSRGRLAAASLVLRGGRVELAVGAHLECPYYRLRLQS